MTGFLSQLKKYTYQIEKLVNRINKFNYKQNQIKFTSFKTTIRGSTKLFSINGRGQINKLVFILFSNTKIHSLQIIVDDNVIFNAENFDFEHDIVNNVLISKTGSSTTLDPVNVMEIPCPIYFSRSLKIECNCEYGRFMGNIYYELYEEDTE